MTDRPDTPEPSSEKRRPSVSVAETIDTIRWDYDPEASQLSPLVSSERYFRDFPWDEE